MRIDVNESITSNGMDMLPGRQHFVISFAQRVLLYMIPIYLSSKVIGFYYFISSCLDVPYKKLLEAANTYSVIRVNIKRAEGGQILPTGTNTAFILGKVRPVRKLGKMLIEEKTTTEFDWD